MLLKIAGTTYLITFFNSPIRQNASPAHFAGYCVIRKSSAIPVHFSVNTHMPAFVAMQSMAPLLRLTFKINEARKH